MLKVKELTEYPKEFLDVLPKTCEICGQDNEITETLTILRCGNPKCPEKGIQRMVAAVADLGIKNLGEAKCRKFCHQFNYFTPYLLFPYELEEDGVMFDGCSVEFTEQIIEQIDERRNMMLWEYVKLGNIPGIRDSARYLFGNYYDLDSFYEDLEDGRVEFVQNLLSIDENKFSIKAVEIYENLLLFKDELYFGIDWVNIITASKTINICISTSVGSPYTSKKDFIDTMNSMFGDKVHINTLSNVSRDCDCLIWSGIDGHTSKVKKAIKLDTPILTGEEFKEYLFDL